MPLLPLLLFVVTATLSAAPAGAEWLRPDVSYSATRVMRAAGMEMSGRVYHDGGKERWETTAQGMRQVMIRRPDQGYMLMILPEMNMGMEMDLSQASRMPSAATYAGRQPEEMGREEVGGEMTTKYRLVEETGSGPFTIFFWVTDDGIPLRMEGAGGEGRFEMVLSDVVRGPQDAALFEPPAGLQLMPANPAMMGPMMGGAAQ